MLNKSVRSIRVAALLIVVAAVLAGSAAAGLALVPARLAEAQSCDASLWKRVYNPDRLTVVSSCIFATGTIAESNADDDGDQHFLLKLDKGQKALLN
ncbi:MAG TPA: hypothetical protein VFC35_05695, partial [Gemmatimonadaceae bacterium]|nr:hypothetical protein [Gemmatimonadaceae bacterium]